jgi:hypothetical protein
VKIWVSLLMSVRKENDYSAKPIDSIKHYQTVAEGIQIFFATSGTDENQHLPKAARTT